MEDRGKESPLLKCAKFETGSRLLASLVNERFVKANITKDATNYYCTIRIQALRSDPQEIEEPITVRTKRKLGRKRNGDVISFLFPDELVQHITAVLDAEGGGRQVSVNPAPELLFELAYSWFEAREKTEAKEQIMRELHSSFLNQGCYLSAFDVYCSK